ncbi:MAG: energy-coupling factor ABC transporter ATP-binding protein [Gemmatimonas sp.]
MTATSAMAGCLGVAVGLRDVHVSHRTAYGQVRALCGASFTAPAGQVTLLAGPNGAGKSSALATLAGLQRAARGQVLLKERWHDAGRVATAARGVVGWLGSDPDDQLIAPRVHDDIAFGLLNRGESATNASARVAAMAEQRGIAPLLSRSIDGLSHGERQRVALAGVLVLEPRVLLLDEPTLGLDRRGHRALLTLLSSFRARGMTMVVASHDEQLADGWADHVVLFEGGTVVLEGPSAESVIHPAWRRVLGLAGS